MTDTAKPTPGIWTPIATLPNKSGVYLVCDFRTQDIWVAAYNDGQGKNKDSWGDDRATGWVGYTWAADATHWMPCPPLPNPNQKTTNINLTPRQLLERVRELEAEKQDMLSVLQNIGVYGCGMLSQPAAMNAPEESWLRMRIQEMEFVAREAFFKYRGQEAALAKHGEGV